MNHLRGIQLKRFCDWLHCRWMMPKIALPLDVESWIEHGGKVPEPMQTYYAHHPERVKELADWEGDEAYAHVITHDAMVRR